MEIKINNITFDFSYSGHDAQPDEENLGLANLFIPGPMAKRFAKEFDQRDMENRLLLPHYDEYEMYEDNEVEGKPKQSLIFNSGHECYNADTQIVLMHYLFSKRRNYKLKYEGLDPYWLFHDSFHAENDVYCGSVDGITSHVEFQRLMQGCEFAKSKGFEIQEDTVKKLLEAWHSRWRYRERDTMQKLTLIDFHPFMNLAEYENLQIEY